MSDDQHGSPGAVQCCANFPNGLCLRSVPDVSLSSSGHECSHGFPKSLTGKLPSDIANAAAFPAADVGFP